MENSKLTTSFNVSNQNPCQWRPATDVYRDRTGWLIKCELAGVMEKDIQLAAEGNQLSITGHRRDLQVKSGHRTQSMEIAYNSFERLVEIPMDIENAIIRTAYEDGMLLVYLQWEQNP